RQPQPRMKRVVIVVVLVQHGIDGVGASHLHTVGRVNVRKVRPRNFWVGPNIGCEWFIIDPDEEMRGVLHEFYGCARMKTGCSRKNSSKPASRNFYGVNGKPSSGNPTGTPA